MQQICGKKAPLEPGKLSGVLVELAPGATSQQARFAILANLPGVKVVSNESMLTSIRQGLAVLLDGTLALMLVMFASTALMVGVLFSAIITERRRELGLLKAIGARRAQIVGMLLCEAALATAVGGLIGCVLGALLLRVLRALARLLSRQRWRAVRLARHDEHFPDRACLHRRGRGRRRGGRFLSGMEREPRRAL